MEKEKDGVWRTIRGRRIFIASGQSLGEAMAKSGKFKREDIREGKRELSRNIASRKAFSDETNKKQSRKAINKLIKSDSTSHYRSGTQDEKNRINENAETQKFWQKRVLRNYDKYSETDRREIAHENLQKKLAEYKAKKQSNNKIEKDDLEEKYKHAFPYHKKSEAEEKYIKEVQEYYKDKNIEEEIKKAKEEGKKWEHVKAVEMSNEEYERYKQKIAKEIYESGKQSNNKVDNEYHFAGEELYSDDPHRYDDTIKSTQVRKEKFKADDNFKKEKHIGWGEYNKDGVPVYNNDIDYKGDFGWANLKTLSNDDLTKALNIQSEEYNKANAEKVGDRRTRNGRMDKIFKDAKVGKYEQGMKRLNEEMQKRDMPRYNIYDKKNPNTILVSSPTKEIADKQIQDMYKTDISLQKEYGWKELPKYDYRVGKVDDYLNEIKDEKVSNNNTYKFAKQKYNTRVEKNFDNYGRADKEEAINNEIEKTIKRYKQRKGK